MRPNVESNRSKSYNLKMGVVSVPRNVGVDVLLWAFLRRIVYKYSISRYTKLNTH